MRIVCSKVGNLLITNIFSFEVDLYIGGEMITSGFGTSLQRAELDAANKAVQQISEERGVCYPRMVSKNYHLLGFFLGGGIIGSQTPRRFCTFSV